MSLTFTPFPMYDFPELAAEHALLWRRIVALVRRSGLAHEVPLTQVCGYPLATSLRQRFDAIAAPVYDVPFRGERRTAASSSSQPTPHTRPSRTFGAHASHSMRGIRIRA